MTINLKFPFSRFIIHEESMIPAYKPGDRVLTFNWVSPKVGDVIVFESGGKKYLKRINKVVGDLIYVAGDNKRESLQIDPIKRSQIVGKVIRKY